MLASSTSHGRVVCQRTICQTIYKYMEVDKHFVYTTASVYASATYMQQRNARANTVECEICNTHKLAKATWQGQLVSLQKFILSETLFNYTLNDGGGAECSLMWDIIPDDIPIHMCFSQFNTP